MNKIRFCATLFNFALQSSAYTGRQPLWGNGVTSRILPISIPAGLQSTDPLFRDRYRDSYNEHVNTTHSIHCAARYVLRSDLSRERRALFNAKMTVPCSRKCCLRRR